LQHLVDFRHGSALAMPFADTSFDVAIGQEAFAHVPDKPRLIAECARVVEPGGTIAFTDIMAGRRLTLAAAARVQRDMAFAGFETLDLGHEVPPG
jgi:ubiquinone/menaquinone biosynthesis C-methylase UbiE